MVLCVSAEHRHYQLQRQAEDDIVALDGKARPRGNGHAPAEKMSTASASLMSAFTKADDAATGGRMEAGEKKTRLVGDADRETLETSQEGVKTINEMVDEEKTQR